MNKKIYMDILYFVRLLYVGPVQEVERKADLNLAIQVFILSFSIYSINIRLIVVINANLDL